MKNNLPTLSELIGIDKFDLTENQKHDCKSLANYIGFEAAVEQAKIFQSKNTRKNPELLTNPNI